MNKKHIEDRIAQLKGIMLRTEPIWNSSFKAPGAFVTGRSNRPSSLNKMVDRENERKSLAFKQWDKASKELKMLEARLKLVNEGEVHPNGQPVANSPSRQRRREAEKTYAQFIRSIVKPKDKLALADNPRNTIVAKRLNKKTITCESGTRWTYDEVLPLNDEGNAMSESELRQALKQWYSNTE